MAKTAFWPGALDRASAPEAAGPGAARVIENLDSDTPGRLKRRRGMAGVSVLTYADAQTSDVTSAMMCVRRDGVALIFDGDAAGVIRLRTLPVVSWTDVNAFGAVGTDGFNQEFNEEGN